MITIDYSPVTRKFFMVNNESVSFKTIQEMANYLQGLGFQWTTTERAFDYLESRPNPSQIEPSPYIAANGHKMVETTPGQSWNAVCTDDCKACNEGDQRPDW